MVCVTAVQFAMSLPTLAVDAIASFSSLSTSKPKRANLKLPFFAIESSKQLTAFEAFLASIRVSSEEKADAPRVIAVSFSKV